MKHIFLTGGTGFFGKSIINYINENKLDIHLVILSRHELDKQFRFPFVEQIFGDIRTFDLDYNNKFDYIIHAATPATTNIDDNEMKSIIVDGTKHVLDIAKKHDCRRFLFTSSGAVYGNYNRPIFETDKCNPVTAYGKGKLEAEKLCLSSDLDVVIARCFAFSGKYLNKKIHFAIGNFVQNAIDNTDITITGDGKSIRSYLDQDDLVRWLMILLEKTNNKSIYNIGSNISISIKELAYKVKKLINNNIQIKILNTKSTIHNKNMYLPNIDKFINDFNISKFKSLDQSIIEMSRVV